MRKNRLLPHCHPSHRERAFPYLTRLGVCVLSMLIVGGALLGIFSVMRPSHAAPAYDRSKIYSASEVDEFLTDSNGKMAFWTSANKSTADVAISYQREIQDIYYLASLCGGHSLTGQKLSHEVTAAAGIGNVTLDLEGQLFIGGMTNDDFVVNVGYNIEPLLRFKVNQKGHAQINKGETFNLNTAKILNEVSSGPNEAMNKYVTMRDGTGDYVVPMADANGTYPSVAMIDNGAHANVLEYAKNIVRRLGTDGYKPDVLIISYDPYAWALATVPLEGTTAQDAQIMRQAAELLAPYYENNKVIWLVSDNCASSATHRVKTAQEMGMSATSPITDGAYRSVGESGWENYRNGPVTFEALLPYIYPKSYDDFIAPSKRLTFLDANNSADDSFYSLAGKNFNPAEFLTFASYPQLETKMREANAALAALGVPEEHRFTSFGDYVQYLGVKYAYAHGEQSGYLDVTAINSYLHITRAKYNEIMALPADQRADATQRYLHQQMVNESVQNQVKLSKKHAFYQFAILDPQSYLERTDESGMPKAAGFPALSDWSLDVPAYAYGDAEAAGQAINDIFSQYDQYVITDTLASGLVCDDAHPAEVAYYDDATSKWVAAPNPNEVQISYSANQSGQHVVTANITDSFLVGKRIRLLIHTKSPSFFHSGQDSNRQPKDTNAGQAKAQTKNQGEDSFSETFTSPKLLKDPRISLTKTVASVSDNAVTWGFTVTNDGDIPLTDVHISDELLTQEGHRTQIVFTGGGSTIPSLAVGATATATARMPLTNADMLVGQVDNTATATGTFGTADDAHVSDTSTASATFSRSAELTIEKTVDGQKTKQAQVGETVTYAIKVRNTGNVPLTNVTITDDKLGVSSHVIAESLYPGEWSDDYTQQYVIKDTDAINNSGELVNTASAHGTPPAGVAQPEDPTSSATVHVTGTASLAIEKSVNPTSVVGPDAVPGTQVVWHFVVRNTGNMTINNLAIVDPLLTGRSIPVTIDNNKTTLAPNESATASATMPLTQADIDAGKVTNTAHATGKSSGNADVTSNEDDAEVTIARTANLTVEKVPANNMTQVSIGENAVFKVTVTNTGNVTLAPVTINDELTNNINTEIAASLAPGASADTLVTYGPVTEADAIKGSVDNVVTAHGTPPTNVPQPQDPQDDSSIPVVASKSIEITKSVTPTHISEAKVGDTVKWTIAITNTGSMTLSGITLTDELLTARGITPTLSKTSLAPGETMTLSDISMPVNQTDIDNGGVTNTALAKAQDPLDSSKQIESNLATAQVTLDRVAKLAIEKEASKKTVAIGESFTYTITVTNTGNVALTNVTITDEKLNVHDEVVSTQLAPGASASKTYEAVATQDDAIAGSIYNVASADGTPPTGVTKPQKPTDDETVTVTGSPALTIEKGVTPNTKIMNPVAGETEVTWSFQVTNSGNVTISGISVTDEMLAQRNQTVTLDKTTLNPGESATGSVKMKLTQADINASFVKNVATASGHPVTNPSQSVTTQPSEATVTIGRTAQLALVKTSAITQAAIGDEEVAFTLTATNTGSVTLTNVIVNDPLTGSQNVPVSPSTLNPGESGTVVVKYGPVTQEDAIAGTIHNVATAHGTPPDGVEWPSDPQATKDVPVISTRTLRLEKSVDPEKIDDAKPGDKVTWTLKVTNTGNVTLSNITVTDELLTGRNLPVTLDKTTLTPGESASATVSMEITQADINAGKVVNVAIAHADDPVNQNSTVESNSATAETILPRHADFTVTKTADKQTAKAGDTIKWEITVTNTGHVALRNVRINDELVGLTEKVVAEILEPQKQVTFSVDYVVTEADAKNGQVKNIVTARGDVPSGMDPLDEKEADATVQVAAPPATPTPTPTPTQPTPTPSRPSASNVMSELIQTGIRNPVPTVIGLVSVSATAILVLYKRRKR